MKDNGRFVGNYLRLLGFATLISMLITTLYINFISINLSFILLIWAGSELTRHNPTARTWVIRFSFLSIIAIIATCAYIGYIDKKEVSMDLFGVYLPALPVWLFYVTMAGLAVLCFIPAFYLLKPGTGLEFETFEVKNPDPADTDAA